MLQMKAIKSVNQTLHQRWQGMARYKHYDYNQTKMIPLRFSDQIQLGTFEYYLNHVVDNDLDLSVFESRYRNDYNGAPAYSAEGRVIR